MPTVLKKPPRLVVWAALLVAGEWTGFCVGPVLSPLWGWVLTGAVLMLAYLWGCGARVAAGAFFCLGLVLALRTEWGLAHLLAHDAGLLGETRRPYTVRIESEPATWRSMRSPERYVSFFTEAEGVPLKVVALLPPGRTPPAWGETWRVDGALARRKDGEGRWKRRVLWVGRRGIFVREKSAPSFSSARCWDRVAQELARRASLGLEAWPEWAGLNRAMLLGRRSELAPERRRTFADAGTIHVFAISGLHVMVVACLLRLALGRFGLGARAQGLWIVPLLAGYTVLTGARPSAMRATLMASVWFLAPVFGRRSDALLAWSATALVVYALTPRLLFDLGCLLSFGVMLGIVLWCRWARRHVSPFPDWQAMDPGLRRWLLAKAEALAAGFCVSVAAWVAGVPIMAAAFGRFTPGGLLANLVVILCAGCAVKLGACGILASFACVPLAALLNLASAGFTRLMALVSEAVAALPGTHYTVVPWSWPTCLAWYVGWLFAFALIAPLVPRRDPTPRRWWK